MADRVPVPGPPRCVRTWCPACSGLGGRWIPRRGMLDRLPAATGQLQRCRTCAGTGRLTGFRPPV